MLNGYDGETWDEYWNRTLWEASNSRVDPHAGQTSTIVTTYHPAQPAILGTPAVPPIPPQINFIENIGWNTWARSIEQLLPGKFIEYTVSVGARGAFVGIGGASELGNMIRSFQYGILIDLSGIWVFELGVKVKLLMATDLSTARIRIYLQADNTIIYFIIAGTESLVHECPIKAKPVQLYGCAYLYSASDTITSARLPTGEVKFGSV